MSATLTDTGPISCQPIPDSDPLALAKRTHQVFVEQLAEILACDPRAASVIEATVRLQDRLRRALASLAH